VSRFRESPDFFFAALAIMAQGFYIGYTRSIPS